MVLGTAHMWIVLTYFLVLPGIGVSMLSVFLNLHHREHKRPEFVAYLHLHTRSKSFTWEDRNYTLYQNSHMNPLLIDYEYE